MKKYLFICGLSLLLVIALLAGCTGVEDDPVSTNPPVGTNSPVGSDTGDVETSAESNHEDPAETVVEEVTTSYFEATRIETVQPDTTKVPDVTVTGLGYDIYKLPIDQDWGYRYGVTYLYNDDGSVDAYFACVGVNGEWDWISYRHSPDGGETWTPEKIVLTPTQGSMDHFSNCDPGVVYFNGYYYLGYTSTLNETGACNNVFVARSKNPDGPFEKWNGSGWGGYEPQPIFYYDEDFHKFGMGEPSFVELNGTLYIYYTNAAPSGEYTMVATADATDENWPATIQHHGAAVQKNTASLDVKYVEEWGKFIALATGSRMGPSSYLAFYESNDGLTFELVEAVREGTLTHLHNAGLSSRRNGRIRLSEDADKLRVIYAHGEGWGTWNTRVQPISMTLSDGNDIGAEMSKPCLKEEFVRGEAISKADRHYAMVRPDKDVYNYTLKKGSFLLRVSLYDTYFEEVPLKRGAEGITFKVHDESVCTIEDWRVTFVGVGTTAVEVWYEDNLSFLFHICVTTEEDKPGRPTQPVEWTPVRDTYVISLPERTLYKPQIRAQMKWADGSFTEFFVTESTAKVTFTGYDESIISVSDQGIVTALKTGETEVTLTYKEKTCKVKVIVTDDPEQGFYRLKNYVEVNYENLDFSVESTKGAISSANSATVSYDATEQALKAVVTGNDALFYLAYGSATPILKADDYKALEITYKCPTDTSSKAINLQVFYCAGSVTAADANYQVLRSIRKDGEYHTITIDLTTLKGWEGEIHTLRVDFFDQSEVGDTMFIKSIQLIEK